jgi:hypothetical protein
MKCKITEGLQEGDLRDLVLSLISIDQYVPKSGDNKDVIVVAFFVSDGDAAKDLVRFISKTDAQILDVESSPAPNPEGYWLVFVEITRDKEFVSKLINVLNELRAVTLVKKWQARVYRVDKTIDVTSDSLKKYVSLSESHDKGEYDGLQEWLSASNNDIDLFTNQLLETDTKSTFVTLYFGDLEQMPEEYQCPECFAHRSSAAKRLNKFLGSQYQTLDYDTYLLVSKKQDPRVLLLKQT